MKVLKRILLPMTAIAAAAFIPIYSAQEAQTNKSASEMGYNVEVFECDSDCNELSLADRQKKIHKRVVRICFRPNQKAMDDEIYIQTLLARGFGKWNTKMVGPNTRLLRMVKAIIC
jgi:hypothetical protein